MKCLIICPCKKKIRIPFYLMKRKKYCSKKCFYRFRKRSSGLQYKIRVENNGWFKKDIKPWNFGTSKGFYDKSTGYRKVKINGKDFKEHRIIMEKFFHRKLLPIEIVHHKNGVKTDNRIKNLVIMSIGEHLRLHKREI